MLYKIGRTVETFFLMTFGLTFAVLAFAFAMLASKWLYSFSPRPYNPTDWIPPLDVLAPFTLNLGIFAGGAFVIGCLVGLLNENVLKAR